MKPRNRNWLVLLYCMLIAAACLLICSKSSPLYPINDWTDANAYFSCGKGMLNGRVMYRDLYEHKGPLLYALHALCCLVDTTSFLGVFLLEMLAGGLFLFAIHRTLLLYGAKRSGWLALPLIAVLVYSSFSFQQGDSAEELCLPMLAWSLYALLRWLRLDAPRRMSVRALIANGMLCGCVLWIKFTMLGLYGPWIAGLLLYHIARREWRAVFSALGWFALGVGISTLPWVVYFGVNGAILPWLKTYLYDNLFLYQDEPALGLRGRALAMLRSGWDWFIANWAYAVPMAGGLLWFTFQHRGSKDNQGKLSKASASDSRRGHEPVTGPAAANSVAKAEHGLTCSAAEKGFLWTMVGFAALGVFIGGKSYVYYGLALAAFAALGALPLCRLLEPLLARRRVLAGIMAGVLALGSAPLCLAISPNTGDLLKPRAKTMQYQFAAIVNKTPHATLLNYGFMDAGFYTACNIAPSVKYFHQTNVHLQEMLDEQIRYIADGVTDYVVTRGKQPDVITDRYELIATADAPANFWYQHVYLYRRKGLAP